MELPANEWAAPYMTTVANLTSHLRGASQQHSNTTLRCFGREIAIHAGMVRILTPVARRVSFSKSSLHTLNSKTQRRTFIPWRTTAVPSCGTLTPTPEDTPPTPRRPYHFETGYAVLPKRPSRPLPPPFVAPQPSSSSSSSSSTSKPSSSASSEPTATPDQNPDTRPFLNGELIRGLTNGDDAILVAPDFLGVNDGVGAWATKTQGHAALILHFWALEVGSHLDEPGEPDPVAYLQRAYEQTVVAASSPTEWYGTTTSATALLHNRIEGETTIPMLYVTNLGDCQTLVIRPQEKRIILQTEGQWHWFDCPMQLGTNSVDRPQDNATLSVLSIEENDIVIVMSDGVTDNLWGYEVLDVILKSLEKWESGKWGDATVDHTAGRGGGMVYIAEQLLITARAVAQDPFAQTPYMEKAINEGLAIEGGKMDDISIVTGLCTKTKT
ncbi:hypothetical protein FQN57_007021 [Myotisia sp. PD_48]|nr:hypothetical protein FQN57_007021 [Myotisia sp. PD_48]